MALISPPPTKQLEETKRTAEAYTDADSGGGPKPTELWYTHILEMNSKLERYAKRHGHSRCSREGYAN